MLDDAKDALSMFVDGFDNPSPAEERLIRKLWEKVASPEEILAAEMARHIEMICESYNADDDFCTLCEVEDVSASLGAWADLALKNSIIEENPFAEFARKTKGFESVSLEHASLRGENLAP